MGSLERLRVFLRFSNNTDVLVGELVSHKNTIFFKYSRDFLSSGMEISPFKLPLSEKVYEGPTTPFNGLFGVFNDSLPDGWGRLLMDRKLLQLGMLPQEVGPLDRLSMIGAVGNGALIYHPVTEHQAADEPEINLEKIEEETKEVFEGTSESVLDKLFDLGGSSGGARPKINVGYNPTTGQIVNDKASLPNGFEHWIVKFPSSNDLSDIASVEYAYHLMALDAGLEMSVCSLLEGHSGRKYFATKRFDRNNGKRIHMHSAAGLLHDNFRRSALDYGHLMDTAFRLTRDVRQYEKVLRLCAFNVFAHNRDDHSNNFSFLMDSNGNWAFSPVYDLTFSTSSHGMHSTTIAGEGVNPNTDHIKTLASEFGIKNADEIINRVKSVTSNWEVYAEKAGVHEETCERIQKRLGDLPP